MKQRQLIEAVTSAFRSRDKDGGIRSHESWHDLSEQNRQEAFDRTLRARRIEAALDPEGLSTSGRAVLARIQR